MRTHKEIDARSLEIARLVVKKITDDPDHGGLYKARETCSRWMAMDGASKDLETWADILTGDWDDIAKVLLDETENGKRLRQSSPFVGIITEQERKEIFEKYHTK